MRVVVRGLYVLLAGIAAFLFLTLKDVEKRNVTKSDELRQISESVAELNENLEEESKDEFVQEILNKQSVGNVISWYNSIGYSIAESVDFLSDKGDVLHTIDLTKGGKWIDTVDGTHSLRINYSVLDARMFLENIRTDAYDRSFVEVEGDRGVIVVNLREVDKR